MRGSRIIAGFAIVAASFAVSLKAMDWLWPPSVQRPALPELPPLPPVAQQSEIFTPVIIPLAVIGNALDRAAPRNLAGKADNPVSQILQKADITWAVARGPLTVTGADNALTVTTPLDGKLTVLGSLNTQAGSPVSNAIGNLLGNNAAKQLGNISIKSLNASAAIRGNATMTSRPQLTTTWRFDPGLAAQTNLGDTTVTVAGAKVGVPAQVKPVIDKTVNEQVGQLQQRLRTDRTFEQSARREWDKLCRSIALPSSPNVPPLYLEMRPVRAIAAQPRVDAASLTLAMGLQAETRITSAQTAPQCPFPTSLDIVPFGNDGRINIGVPIDLPFTDVSRIIEAQLKGKTFPEDGQGAISATVKSVSVDAAGDRLLISLLVNAQETKSWFGFGGDATVRIWGRPTLDQQQQILRLTDLTVQVNSDAALGLFNAAAQRATPYLQRALQEKAAIDLTTMAASAQQKLADIINGMQANQNGWRMDAKVTSLRLGSILFDSKTLRVIAEASGAINVSVTSLPSFQP